MLIHRQPSGLLCLDAASVLVAPSLQQKPLFGLCCRHLCFLTTYMNQARLATVFRQLFATRDKVHFIICIPVHIGKVYWLESLLEVELDCTTIDISRTTHRSFHELVSAAFGPWFVLLQVLELMHNFSQGGAGQRCCG
ncbi:hypothetical protein ACQ4PT_011317 [Festuca glaucescens]